MSTKPSSTRDTKAPRNPNAQSEAPATFPTPVPAPVQTPNRPHTGDVVAAFNALGYDATFAAVAAKLEVGPEYLYQLYPSREALGANWLADVLPELPAEPRLYDMFAAVLGQIFDRLQSQRDFSRAWLSTVKLAGPLHLTELQRLHETAQESFASWLDANQASISLPDRVLMQDVHYDLADAMSAVTAGLIEMWGADRSVQCRNTWIMMDSVARLLDALLMTRTEFGEAGLLTHLARLLDVPHQQFVKPLLDTFLKPERAKQICDPIQLIEALRALRPTSGRRT